MRRRFWLSAAAYFVVTMALAWPWHMVLFHDAYVAMGAFTRDPPIVALGMLAIVLQALVFAALFPLYLQRRGGNEVRRGIEFSLLLGLVVYSVMVPATAAKFTIEPVGGFLAYGTAFQLLQFLAVGVVLGLIHRRRR